MKAWDGERLPKAVLNLAMSCRTASLSRSSIGPTQLNISVPVRAFGVSHVQSPLGNAGKVLKVVDDQSRATDVAESGKTFMNVF